ncbi:hypothetical protein D3C87_1849850 [compost metagenome]
MNLDLTLLGPVVLNVARIVEVAGVGHRQRPLGLLTCCCRSYLCSLALLLGLNRNI